MKTIKTNKARLNILMTLLSQAVATVCGIIIPQAMIRNFGSAVYGATTSIAQFLSYIALIEGGIGSVARAELYEPLAKNDHIGISRVYNAIRHFFRIVGLVFIGYTLLLSLTYYDLVSPSGIEKEAVFALIWIISVSTLSKYFFGLTDLTLLFADQRQYVGYATIMVATVVNAIAVVFLANSGYSVLVVKTVSSLIYICQPVCYALYIKKHYSFLRVGKERSRLKQKWTGIGQHMAYFLHNNTDVVMLTLFADIRLVAVYNIYRLIVSSLGKIVNSFTGGLEALFGELIAQNEQKELQRSFGQYNFMLLFMTDIFFGTAAVLVVPFVRLYTKGVGDVEYIRPLFACIILFAEFLTQAITLCASLPISANKLKNSRWGAYGEATVNIAVSLMLIWWNPLLGVAIGTLCAAAVKCVYYIWFSSAKILHVNAWKVVKNFLLTILVVVMCTVFGYLTAQTERISDYFQWIIYGMISFSAVTVSTALLGSLFYPEEFRWMCSFLRAKYMK